MSRTDVQVNFRMPAELKARLEQAAKENHRSVTAELVARLENSFERTWVAAHEPLVVIEEHGPSIDGSPLCSKKTSVLPTPHQIMQFLAQSQAELMENQARVAHLYAELQEALQRERPAGEKEPKE